VTVWLELQVNYKFVIEYDGEISNSKVRFSYYYIIMHRTHTCGELTLSHVGQTVTLSGWVDNARKLGWLTFLTLRDRYGITQVSCDPAIVDQSICDVAAICRNEYVVKVIGQVIARPGTMANDAMSTGAIEIVPSSIEIVSISKELPFQIVDNPATSEEQRMKYRYLDLRRRKVLSNIEFRARMNQWTRNRFSDQWFLEVQTPIFTVSSPEWSRDYVIPSRVNPGKFYALPQSPQQYKQLLMMGGIDKYFQIAPCFRDEDPRSDRAMCEFYQIDLEMSFVEQEDVLHVLTSYTLETIKTLTPHKKLTFGDELPRISYQQAMDEYGIDRPDLRFGMKIVDLTSVVSGCGFGVFNDAVAGGKLVRAIKLEWQTMTRKEIDALTEIAKRAGAGGLPYLVIESSEWSEWIDIGSWTAVRSPITKFLSVTELQSIVSAMDAKIGDMIFFAVWSFASVCKVLDKLRITLRDQYRLVDDNELALCFVVDFPFFEWDEQEDGTMKWDFGHNPFSEVVGWLESLHNLPMDQIMTHQYDIICNGYEIGGGSIRNSNPEVLVAAFEKVGYDEQTVKERFGTMYEAFQYWCPPHGGCAFGFDRLMMILTDESNIRETYAFPKSGRAEDVMMQAPSIIDDTQLEELSIKTL